MPTATRSRHHLLTWPAMGTECRAWMVGAGATEAAALARAEVEALEGRWSRFLPGSDLDRINAAAGSPVAVAPETAVLVAEALRWWEHTAGRFDPTVLRALEAAGYDRDRAVGHGPIGDGRPAPGCRGIVVDLVASTVRLPVGTALDLGGIGKGAAVDRIADQLQARAGGLIDLGGDLRVWGEDPDQCGGWPIAVEDPRTGEAVALLGLASGAVATSTTLRRTWSHQGRHAHHLIDPRSGRPADGELVGATVVAPTATAAEVLAKAAVLSGSRDEAGAFLEGFGVAALVVPREGLPVTFGGFRDLCWTLPPERA